MNTARTHESERTEAVHQRLTVSFHYPVVFTRGVFRADNPALIDQVRRLESDRQHRALAFVDRGVADAWPKLPTDIERYAEAHAEHLRLAGPPRIVPGGERIKNDLGVIRDLMHHIARGGLCRHSYVVIVGGGAVLDAVGFCASLIHRGLRTIRVPTTVLAQNDAGVGVKTGINTDGGKNTAGTFAPPHAVLNDFELLRTLPDGEWIAGAAEAFKVAILKDAEFFAWLEARAEAIPARDEAVMERLIRRCAELHLDHIRTGGDPFETGAARPLDFGHWAAHQLEAMSGWRVGHGAAVAAGIAVDSLYAERQGWLAPRDAERILDALRGAGFALWHPEFDRRAADGSREILRGLETFREHLGGDLCLTFPERIGARREVGAVEPSEFEACFDLLRSRFGPRGR